MERRSDSCGSLAWRCRRWWNNLCLSSWEIPLQKSSMLIRIHSPFSLFPPLPSLLSLRSSLLIADHFDYFRQLFTFPVIIIECTFLHEDKPHEAEERGHTSWDDLKPYVIANPQTTFVIIHFSLRYLLPPPPLSSLLPLMLTFRFRYSNADIDAHFKKENLSNVVAWCDVD